MAKVTHFTAAMFVPTEHCTAKEKAEFANRLASFIVNGFKPGDFANIIYTRLSMCFHHIAHYNREGFYGVWFAGPTKQAEFISHTLDCNIYGQPNFTFSDVEVAFQTWLREQNIQMQVDAKASNERLYAALENIAEHALTIMPGVKTAEAVSVVVNQSVEFIEKFVSNKLDAFRINDIRRVLTSKYATAVLTPGEK